MKQVVGEAKCCSERQGEHPPSSLCQCGRAKPDLGEAAGLCSLIQQGQDDPSVVWGY